MDERDDSPENERGQRRLWTPWRMQYVGGPAKESGCIFCNRIALRDDVTSLILHRSERAIVIMNLYPYNTGHVMIVPTAHIDTPETCDPAMLSDLSALLPPTLRALRRVLGCHGFNIGTNVGSIAGAGIAEHLHEHVVPRWNGDANFMPIIGSAMIIPELIPVSYAKIRAELQRELHPASTPTVVAVVLDQSLSKVALDPSGGLPSANLVANQPVWKAAVQASASLGIEAVPAGWAGPSFTGDQDVIALTLLASPAAASTRWIPIDSLLDPVQTVVKRAVLQIAPLVRTS